MKGKSGATANRDGSHRKPAEKAGQFLIGGDLPVYRLGFGAMRITGKGIWGEPQDPAEAKRVLRRAIELGVNFIDTADSYGPEVSERLIAEALYPYPAGLVISTTYGIDLAGLMDFRFGSLGSML
jgi:pyridoxine 4-dehydrogenase